MPSLMPGLVLRPPSMASFISLPTPVWSIEAKGFALTMPSFWYGGRNLPESSRDMPSVVWVRSLVPNEKNWASAPISSAVRAARGISIMVPTR